MQLSDYSDQQLVLIVQRKAGALSLNMPVANSNDDDWVTEAVDILFDRYKNLIRSKSRSYYFMGADDEDVVQEGFIGLYHAILSYDESLNIPFSSYADVCIVRHILDSIKKYASLKHAPLNKAVPLENEPFNDECNSAFESYISQDPGPEEIALSKDAYERTKSRVESKLSSMEQIIFEYFIEGYSYAEISEKTGYGLKSINNAIMRIKNKFRSSM